MKLLKIYTLWFCAGMILLSCCSKAQNTPPENIVSLKDKKVLIVYLSRTKNTKAVADIIHQHTGGDLVALELQNPYPENYQQIVAQVSEENNKGYLPPLKTKIDSIKKYDLIFVGFPTWGMQLPPPMKSFLTQYDLSGKTIVPFNTHAGYGTGSALQTIKSLCPDSKILQEYATKGGVERDGILFVMQGEKEVQVKEEVRKWLKQIGLIH